MAGEWGAVGRCDIVTDEKTERGQDGDSVEARGAGVNQGESRDWRVSGVHWGEECWLLLSPVGLGDKMPKRLPVPSPRETHFTPGLRELVRHAQGHSW